MKKVSRLRTTVSGETFGGSRKAPGATGQLSLGVGPEPRQFAKGPTGDQWAIMAGSMHNALDKLRDIAIEARRTSDANCGWLQPGQVDCAIDRLNRIANILRVGLKARIR